jgi:hypothetical protein
MGYFKNQLIADQVEEADRVPAPKPATSHVSLTRAQARAIQQVTDQQVKKIMREAYLLTLVAFGLGTVFGAVVIGMVVWL